MVAGYDWFRPSDLPTFFRALQFSEQPSVLVGGQSLTFWVQFFKIPVPETDTPYLTQDADILGTKHDARIVATELGGTLCVPDPNDHTPNSAIVTYATPDGRKLFVDFLGRLAGLNNEEIRTSAVELDHPTYGFIRVLHPRLVLKSRIANLYELPDKRDANGVEQARLAVPALKAFFEHYVTSGRAGDDPDSYLIDQVQWLKKLAFSDAGISAFVRYGIDVIQASPIHMIRAPEFHSRNWPQIIEWIRAKRTRKQQAAPNTSK